MNAKQANRISIRNYLNSIGINPVKSNKRSSLYLAPYRSDATPSLKVSHDQNLWVDYGNDNKGGTLIDLVLRLNPCYTVSDAIRSIEESDQSFFSFHQQNSVGHTKHEVQNTDHERIKIIKINELGENAALNSYLKSRGVGLEIAKLYCKEIYYAIGERNYFGIANKNNGGWSIRNKYWKGCSGQGYSYYQKGSKIHESLSVFEGIFDLLSYVEMDHQVSKSEDFLVLNSLSNLNKAQAIFEQYQTVSLFLDHDPAGRKATDQILKSLPQAKDASGFYKSCKDLNDYYLMKNNY